MSAVGLEFTDFGGAGVRICAGSGPPRIQALTFEQQDPSDPKFPRAYPLLPTVVLGEEGDPRYALGVPAVLAGQNGLHAPSAEETIEFLYRLVVGGRISLEGGEPTALCLTRAEFFEPMVVPDVERMQASEALTRYADLMIGTESQVSILYLSSERVFAVHRTIAGLGEGLLSDDETMVRPGLVQRALEALAPTATAAEGMARFGMSAFCGSPEFQVNLSGVEVTGSALSQELRRQSRRSSEVLRAVSSLPDCPVLLCGPLVGESAPACSPSRMTRLLEDREVIGSSRWSPWALSVGSAWGTLAKGSEKC